MEKKVAQKGNHSNCLLKDTILTTELVNQVNLILLHKIKNCHIKIPRKKNYRSNNYNSKRPKFHNNPKKQSIKKIKSKIQWLINQALSLILLMKTREVQIHQAQKIINQAKIINKNKFLRNQMEKVEIPFYLKNKQRLNHFLI